MLARIADLTWHRPKLVLALIGVFVVAAGVLGNHVEDRLKAAGFTDSASESERATALQRSALGYDATPGLVVLVRARDGGKLDTTNPSVQRGVHRLSRVLRTVVHVGRVTDPLAEPQRTPELIARDGRSVVIPAQLSTADPEDEGTATADEAKRRLVSKNLDVSIGGFIPGFSEVNDQTRKDLTKAEVIAFPVLSVLLLVVFRGVIAAAIPLLLGVISILGTFLMLRVMSGIVDTSLFALNIATGLSLGLAVDYALLLVTRYREELERYGPTQEAHRRTILTAGRTALFSGFTVAAALAALVVLPQRFLYSVAVAGAVVAILSAVMGVLFVGALLSLLGTRINALSVRGGSSVASESDGWYRLARGVMRRPVIVALGSTSLVLAASAPLLSTVLTGPSSQAVPPGQPSYEANKGIQASYPRDLTEAITVTLHGTFEDAELAGFAKRIEAIRGIARGTPFVRASPSVAVANFAPAQAALDHTSQDVVDEIRALPPPGSAKTLISGNTARFMDEKQSLLDHLPLVAGIVAGSTLLLLFLLTGSILLPIKTLLMNLMTLGATLGVVVLAFQDGWLKTPLDYTGPAAVEVSSLVFLFAIIFGLATDYAVLVMARIKEQHDLGASNEEAVATGIGHTGRVITAAAMMIAVVFLAFAVSKVFFMKQIAVGQAVGVLIDATIVRALLVPSLMRLLGEWNWWAPAPLKRFQARYGVREG